MFLLAPNPPLPCPKPSFSLSVSPSLPTCVPPPPAPFPSSEWMVVVDVWNMTKPETGPGLGPKPERQGHRQLPKPKMSMDPKGSNQPQASGQFSYLKTRSGRGPKPERQGHRLLPNPKLSIEPKDSNQPKGIRTVLIFKDKIRTGPETIETRPQTVATSEAVDRTKGLEPAQGNQDNSHI